MALSVCFAANHYRGHGYSEQQEWPHQAPSSGLYSASQHQATIALSCVCEHHCFILAYFGHPLARCVLRYQKSLRGYFSGLEHSKNFPLYKFMVSASSFYTILAYKGSQRITLLLDSRGNLYWNYH